MPSPSFVRFLSRSLALLEDELPWAYRAVAERLGEREVLIRVDGEVLSVRSVPPRLAIRLLPGDADVELSTTRQAIAALIEGRDTLLDAVLAGRVTLRGAVEDLIAFDAGLLAYLQGAVRCPEFAELRDDYLYQPARVRVHAPANLAGACHDQPETVG